MASSYLKRIETLTRILLDPDNPAYSLRPEVLEIVDILQTLATGFDRKSDITADETRTAQGLAISPTMAAMCSDEYLRTIQYLRGFDAAIRDSAEVNGERVVRALYVGTGPLATLAVPLMVIRPAKSVVFEMIDIHETSTRSVAAILESLGLSDRVVAIHCCDAMNYEPDPDTPPDVVMAEIMLAGLENEPQVAVTRCLARKLPDAVFLPESIEVGIIADTDDAVAQPAFVFDRTMREVSGNDSHTLPAYEVTIPNDGPVFLDTRICIYGPHSLERNQSSLTTRRILPFAHTPGETIRLAYRMGEYPGLIRTD
ncbi:MAG: class I SAM-dependent methyltransferase [Litorimonas sp.]